MISRREFIANGIIATAGVNLAFKNQVLKPLIRKYVSNRPPISKRKFNSAIIEETILKAKSKIRDEKIAWMFENCFPNTLDTTVDYNIINDKPDTFVITGDIDAMWLRDSTAQVWPYLPLINKDKKLKSLVAGLINRQTKCILIDPYANALYKDLQKESEWKEDITDMKHGVHERKWEIDSLCYTVRLAYNYWKTSGEISIFDKDWQKAAQLILETFIAQQRKDNLGPYKFERITERQLDTLSNGGYGRPLKPVGLINSSFRPSDDATTFGFLIPSNLFAVESLKQLSEISTKITGNTKFTKQCTELANEIKEAINKYGIIEHLNYGKVYAYEVDGYGNAIFMDDANVPSLLALPYLGCVNVNDLVYQNTRNLVLSNNNPYFFKGQAAEGIGGPHVGYDMIWPMSIIIRALTSINDKEIKVCIKMLRNTDANTGFMHESFHKDNPNKYTRKWFAWANTLFGELILKLINEGKTELLK